MARASPSKPDLPLLRRGVKLARSFTPGGFPRFDSLALASSMSGGAPAQRIVVRWVVARSCLRSAGFRRALRGRSGNVPGGEPDGKAVPGSDQRGVKIEHVDEPEPASRLSRPGPHGNQPSQRVGWPRAGVVHVDENPPGSGPDPRGHRGPAVPPGVTDGLFNPDHQLL